MKQTIGLAELAVLINSNAWRWSPAEFADALGLHRMSDLALSWRPTASDMGTLRKWERFRELAGAMAQVGRLLTAFSDAEIDVLFSAPIELQIAENQ